MLTSNLPPVYDQLTRQQSLGPVKVFQTLKIKLLNHVKQPNQTTAVYISGPPGQH